MNPNLIYLAQTDTTVGFLSQDASKLSLAKERAQNKSFIRVVSSLKNIKARVPKAHKNRVRRAKKTTFIYPNKSSFRVIKTEPHKSFLKEFGWLYSTSANRSGEGFEMGFAIKRAEVLVQDVRGYFEGEPSKIIKLSKTNKKRVR